MSRICQISKKGILRGNKVSHANNKTKKVWHPNLHQKRLFHSESGTWVRVRVSSRVLRTIARKGLEATLRDEGLRLSDVQA